MKTCSKCNQQLEVTHFYRNSKAKDGMHAWCKHCLRISNRRSRTADSFQERIFYVYGHVDVGGDVVYVGKGKYQRAWEVNGRQPAHRAWLKKQHGSARDPKHIVVIVEYGLTEREAFDFERQSIELLKPKFNKEGKNEDLGSGV